MLGILIETSLDQSISQDIVRVPRNYKNPQKIENPWEENFSSFIKRLIRYLTGRGIGEVLFLPFKVVTVRICGKFMGEKAVYKGVLAAVQCIYDIYYNEGFWGLPPFSRLPPCLMGKSL